ncbi:hypothetical protein ACHAXR_006825 [Thalassiosira sp. AJA248-18]
MKSITIAATISVLACLLTTATNAFRPTEFRKKAPTRAQAPIHPVAVQVEGTISESEKADDSRRGFLTVAATLAFTFAKPNASNAAYGQDAKIIMPDVIQGMDDRNKKQCLVESLGNRECLVYLDPDNQLYKGTDGNVCFERLGNSIAAMKDLPTYIESKQWNKVHGVMTGPMGTLSSTMNDLTNNIDDDGAKNKVKNLSVDIRKDLYAISGAADRKNVKEALSAFEKAEVKLDKFVSLVSSK